MVRINLAISFSSPLEIIFGIMFLFDFIHNLFVNTGIMTFNLNAQNSIINLYIISPNKKNPEQLLCM